LSDGQVLVAGGLDQSEAGRFHLKSAEIFDPVSLVWTATADLNVARSFHTMTLLLNGQVLVAGGDDATSFSNSLNSAELFDSGHRFENHHLSGLSEGLRASDALGTGP
jgi:hypothetical protein